MSHFLQVGDGKYAIWAEVVEAGNDLLVYIGGGERPHIGGASFMSPRGAPFSLSCPKHKDYIVSSDASIRISAATGRTCLVVVGIHVDNASISDIEKLLYNSERCVDLLVSKLKESSQ